MTLDTLEYELTVAFHDVIVCAGCPNPATVRATQVCCRAVHTVCDGCVERARRLFEGWVAAGRTPECKPCGRPVGYVWEHAVTLRPL